MTATTNGRGLWNWTLVQVIIGLALLFYVGLFFIHGFQEETTRVAIRVSAQLSFFLFCGAFGASSLQFFTKNSLTFWLRMNRRYLGVAFAISHLLHLLFLIILQTNFHPVFTKAAPFSIFAGGMAYLFLTLMLLTSFPIFARYLSKKQWILLHTVGGYWIWTIFMSSYFKRTLDDIEYAPYVIILLLILGLRLYKRFYKK